MPRVGALGRIYDGEGASRPSHLVAVHVLRRGNLRASLNSRITRIDIRRVLNGDR